MKKAAPRVPLEEALLKAVTRAGGDLTRAQGALDKLEPVYGAAVYPALLRLLTRLEFNEPSARRYWGEVTRHAEALGRTLQRPVDFRVAMADYFVSHRRKIRHPMVVEIQLYQRAEAERLTDDLTGLYNFRYMKTLLTRMVAHAGRTGQPLGLAFFDLDDFKSFNDRYGHEAGNVLLRKLAVVVTRSIREMDVACRYGGEEFALLLPGADKFGALAVAERVRRGLETLGIRAARPGRIVTLSGGVACYPADADSGEDLLAAADSAMYHAKSQGKNRVELASAERRSSERHRETFAAHCTLDRTSFRIRGENLARGGCYGVAGRPVEVGSSVDLTLQVPTASSRPTVIRARARVTRCEPLDGEGFGVALALTRMAPEDRKRYETALAECGHA